MELHKQCAEYLSKTGNRHGPALRGAIALYGKDVVSDVLACSICRVCDITEYSVRISKPVRNWAKARMEGRKYNYEANSEGWAFTTPYGENVILANRLASLLLEEG